MFRSILSVVTGYVVMAVIIILSLYLLGVIAPEYGLHRAPADMPLLPVLLSLAFSAIAAVAGGYVTTVIARDPGRAHAMALAALIVILGTAHAVMNWNHGAPGWYLIVLPIIGAIAAVAGGALRSRRPGGPAPITG